MTRIIAGSARGRRLAVPGSGTRPTSDRVRESLFSTLDSEWRAHDLAWAQVRVLDLFAGSGALGLEALSRGAASATLVERARPAVRTLEANVTAVGIAGARVLVRDVRQLASVPAEEPADLVFADPPYDWAADDLRTVLQGLVDAGWIADGALAVVERPVRDEHGPLPDAWTDVRRRTYGDTALWYGRAAATAASTTREVR